MQRTRALFIAATLVVATLASSSALASSDPVDAAHQVVVEDGQLRVTSRWFGHLPRDTWTFAAPLPAGTRTLNRGATLAVDPDDQRVLGIDFDERPAYPLVLELEIPHRASDSILALPLPPEPGWQRVEIAGDYRLIPDEDAGVLLHSTGYYAPEHLHVPKRLRIDRGLDHRHPAGAAYLPGAVVREAGGVPGRLESGAARKLGLGVVAGAAFVSGLLVLAVIFRRSAAKVRVEEAEAYLDAELRRLDNDASEPS